MLAIRRFDFDPVRGGASQQMDQDRDVTETGAQII
jgi:hypothetical protein